MDGDAQRQDVKADSKVSSNVEVPPELDLPSEPGSNTPKMTHDSMVTVRLSEPPALKIDTIMAVKDPNTPSRPHTAHLSPSAVSEAEPCSSNPVPRDENDEDDGDDQDNSTGDGINDEKDDNSAATNEELPSDERDSSSDDTGSPTSNDEILNTPESDDCNPRTKVEEQTTDIPNKEQESGEDASSIDEDVDWDELQKTEAQEPKDKETDRSTAMLLAMLEKENNKLATNPKSIKVQVAEQMATQRPRPPSMAQLRDMVNGPTPPALRYSMLPPPPMTDLEFYAALVKDYHQTAARLPTLLSNKIRKGVPPPLRGVVWQSMSGARDGALEEQYERFSGESSPYEPIIGKDLGRSFPGVDMFRDSDGDGQRMLGKVLKCFSLYDQKIGYCQGLAFLVGPLLMHMPDKEAFCVLVRLMERYDLRSCFLPDLSGLHVRIYQFRELMRENLPLLASHMEDLQVDPAYVSQWFLSFFAVTCPLPMLFRIYDVIFAEGAPETLMRVALSLMRKNQARILSCTEFEDVMQLLLSRGLWDCYHYDADEFVQDFVSLTGVVSREKLLQLEQGYREAQIATANAARTSDVATAASRFLGRIWASSSPKPSNLSPGLTAPSRPLSMLRRSASKQSLASTLNSMEASSVSVLSSTSTEATTVSRDSAATTADDGASIKVGPSGLGNSVGSLRNAEERHLHSQIEDLLTALSELQRNHALLASELQKEREQREEDRQAVRSLLDGLRRKASSDSVSTDTSTETVTVESGIGSVDGDAGGAGDKDSTDESDSEVTARESEAKEATADPIADVQGEGAPSAEDLSKLLDVVEERFRLREKSRPRSSTIQSKAQLRRELGQLKDQLASAMSQGQDFGRRIHDLDQEVGSLKDQLRDSHAHTRNLHQEKQRLEKQVHVMRARASAADADTTTVGSAPNDWPKTGSSSGGLRELKLSRSKSTPSQAGSSFGNRTSSLARPHESTIPTVSSAMGAPTSEHEALLLELVQAKTAQAIAKQEAEEATQKLESLRKAYGLAPIDTPPISTAASAALGVFGRLTGSSGVDLSKTGSASLSTPATPSGAGNPTTTPASSGGFWGWRRAA